MKLRYKFGVRRHIAALQKRLADLQQHNYERKDYQRFDKCETENHCGLNSRIRIRISRSSLACRGRNTTLGKRRKPCGESKANAGGDITQTTNWNRRDLFGRCLSKCRNRTEKSRRQGEDDSTK